MKTKRFLALLLATVMSVFIFAACGDEDASTPEATVKACVEELLDADFKGALQYVSEECNGYEQLKTLSDVDAALEKEEMSEEERELVKYVFKAVTAGIPELAEKVTYKVGEAEVDGDNATVLLTVPKIVNYDYAEGKIINGLMSEPEAKSIIAKFMNGSHPTKEDIDALAPIALEIIEKELESSETNDIEVELKKSGEEWKIAGFEF